MGVHYQTEMWRTNSRTIKLERFKRKRSMSKRKFKVGDRVVGTGVYSGINIKGLVGTVITMNSASYGIEFDEEKSEFHSCLGKGKAYHCWNVAEDKIELYDKTVIVIYRKDNHVIAHNKVTGKKGIAKCNPEDTFDFNIGAKLAFERLMSTNRIVKQDKYEVGDKVKIIDKWVDGCDENLDGKMDKHLGTVMTIRKIIYTGDYLMEEDKSEHSGHGWYWNDKCIEGKVVEGYTSAETTEEPKKEEPKKLYNGKVVCIDNVGNPNSYTVGKIYEFKDGRLKGDNGGVYPLFTPIYTFEDWEKWTSAKFIEVIE